MLLSSIVFRIFLWWVCWGISVAAFVLPRTKEYRGSGGEVVSGKNGIAAEPSCEELKAMWRFSKRQSRAAEITNEIPMYRDPFSDNVWEPYYATSRSIGGMRIGRFRGRPIYGRIVHNAPVLRIQDVSERNKAFEEVARLYGTVQRQNEPRRRLTTFRLPGGGHLPTLGFPPQQGSFQHLKELIRTERARELQEQRMAEEDAARAAIKELGGNGNKKPGNYREANYNYDIEEPEDDHNSYVGGRGGIIAFPDLLAPAARLERPDPVPLSSGDSRYIQDYAYTRGRPRTHTSTLFDTSSFNNGFNGYMF